MPPYDETPQTFNNPSSTTSVRSKRKLIFVICLFVLLVVGAVSGIYLWQHGQVESANKKLSTLNSRAQTLEKEASDNKAKAASLEKEATQGKTTPAASPAAPKTETDKEQIQRVATAWINRFKSGTPSDKPNFKPEAKTVINGNFAIQYHCGGYECSQIWLKKVGNTWSILGTGMGLDGEELTTYVNDYGWPASFKQ